MSDRLDIVVVSLGRGTAPRLVGSTSTTIVVDSDPKRSSARIRARAFDVRTGHQTPGAPGAYEPVQSPAPTLEGEVAIRVTKEHRSDGGARKKPTKHVELVRGDDGPTVVLTSAEDAKPFNAGSFGGVVCSERLAVDPNVLGPKRDTRRLIMTLADATSAPVTVRLPWWVAAFDRDSTRLLPWQLVVCMRARVLVVVAAELFVFSLDALRRLLAEARADSRIGIHAASPTTVASKPDMPILYGPLVVHAMPSASDPECVLAELLGCPQRDVERKGSAVLLTESAAGKLERALRACD